MTLVMFGIGLFVFFISVYGAVVAGGLRLTASQLDHQPELAAQAGLGDKSSNEHITVSEVTSTSF